MTAPHSRRRFLRLSATGTAAGLLGWAGHAREPGGTPPGSDTGAEFITPPTQGAIDRGLTFLARAQLDDGSFPAAHGSVVGVTALAGLALMAAGHQPGRGALGRVVSRAADAVLAAGGERTRGLLAGDAFHPGRAAEQQAIYGHGFACLFLAEVCGMLPDADRQRRVRQVLERAVGYTVGEAAKYGDGGWGYTRWNAGPVADSSVTVAQLMALRAAKNAGVPVRKAVIDGGVKYLKACQQADGGFSYYRTPPGPSGFARSAAAIVGLYSAGVYDGREVERGLQYLRRFTPGRQFMTQEIRREHYYYGQYYAALAMWTAGGEFWAAWFPAIRDELLARAHAGGGGVWGDEVNGAAYATAMALIVLQLPNNYLPILQK